MAVDAGAAEVPGGPRQGTVGDGASTSNRSTTSGIANEPVTKGTCRVDIIDGALDTPALHGSLRELAEQGLSEASRRRICEERAQSVLKALEEGRCDMSDDVLRYVMLLWTGTNNRYRKRVNPPGQDFVKSVSLGVISQHTGEVMTSSMTKSHPALTRVLNLYAQSVCSKDFKWTTITVNDGLPRRDIVIAAMPVCRSSRQLVITMAVVCSHGLQTTVERHLEVSPMARRKLWARSTACTLMVRVRMKRRNFPGGGYRSCGSSPSVIQTCRRR